tara:strand:+ start:1130 stop:1840 length:711 start_codon:yes stop_codon:yes gene_type:complete
MTNKDYQIYLNLSSTKLSCLAFKKPNNIIFFSKEQSCINDLNHDQLNLLNLENVIESNIVEVEKVTSEFIKDIYLMIDIPDSITIGLSLIQDNENKIIKSKDVQYLIQDARQQILRSYFDKKIIHIIIENYTVDDVEYDYLPSDLSCKNFSVNIKFICFPKKLTSKLEEIFNNQKILISKFICSKYAKSVNKNDDKLNSCEYGVELINDFNKQEVVIVPKKVEKKGFFEKLFHLFE